MTIAIDCEMGIVTERGVWNLCVHVHTMISSIGAVKR